MLKILYYYLRFSLRAMMGRERCRVPRTPARKCYVFLAADYGNLGDVAITHAQSQWLRQQLPAAEIVDIPISRTLDWLHDLRQTVRESDLITITGGGNMSEQYADIELLRLLVVRSFPRNRIIIFPQSAFFGNNSSARMLCRLGRRIYGAHPQLTMLAREKYSHRVMEANYPGCRVVAAPDIVLTLDERSNRPRARRAIFCLRKDAEKSINSATEQALREQVRAAGMEILEQDTHIGDVRLNLRERERALNKILHSFSGASLVVTDRLHGMIFAFITGTPALVLPNNNGKIAGVWEWIRDCGFIEYTEGADAAALLRVLQARPRFGTIHHRLCEQMKQALHSSLNPS